MKQLCAEASMGPIRDILESSSMDIATVDKEQVLFDVFVISIFVHS